MRRNAKLIAAARRYNRYYKLDNFQPHQFQREWYWSGIHATLRYLSAANQIGKTFGAAVEMAYHSTGLYPDWWPGRRFDVIDKETMWAMGVSLESTRKVLQSYLIGTDNAKKASEIGSGLIPREMIRIESVIRDGEIVKSVSIEHIGGGYVELYFYASTQDTTTLHGQKVLYIWLDEQPANELELSGIFAARTLNTGGMVAITATPEKGATDLWTQCAESDSPHVHFQTATWDDAPHLTPERREQVLAAFPYHERDMRSKGIPVAGVGAVYPFADDDVTCIPFEIPAHWKVLAGLDYGGSGRADPSIILSIAQNPDTGTAYVFQEWSSVMDRDVYANAHMEHYLAAKVTGQAPDNWDRLTNNADFEPLGYPGIVMKSPHDGRNAIGNAEAGTNATRMETMEALGANVHPQVFEIPPDLAPMAKVRNSLSASIGLVVEMFRLGQLKIFTTCTQTLKERRGYQWVSKGQKTVPIDKNNHFMDAMRIAAIRVRDDGESMASARINVRTMQNYARRNDYTKAMGAFSK
ncbi:UNVERIFIED_ORG: phage terminase large subunit-like protein [Buttiauxella agrestis ATCC 33320]